MIRTSYRPLVTPGLFAALLAVVGCGPKSGVETVTVTPTTTPAPGPHAPSPGSTTGKERPAPFASGPAPAGVLVISGEQNGYLEPCGCTEGQIGGLRRRFTMVERLRERQWPLVLIDLGNLVKDPAGARGGPEQAKVKFGVALDALVKMKYDAVALGAEDLKVGVDEALARFLNLGERPKIVAANLVAPGFEATILPSLRVSAGPVRLGITAVLDPEALARLQDPAKDTLSVKPPEAVLAAVLADLEKDTRVQVLMVQGPPEQARKLAEAFPGFEIVVSTSHYADPPEDAEALNGGKTLLISVGQKGKYVGAVGLFEGTPSTRYERVRLDRRFDGPAEPIRALLDEEFQATLKTAGVVENYPRHDFVNGTPGATFVGAEACKSCHPNTFAKWATTKHANAYHALIEDPKRNREYDAECISCHTTGFEYTSGWRSPALTSYLKGNQCENCHGPASKHSAEPNNAEFRKAIARTAADADRNRLCVRCHDEDNSPKFDFATFWGKIAHKGLDTYDDPKVHQGQVPKVARQGEN